MEEILSLLSTTGLAPALEAERVSSLVELLCSLTSSAVYASSVTVADGAILFLARRKVQKMLGLVGRRASRLAAGFHGERCELSESGGAPFVLMCPTDHENAAALRAALPFTAPQLVGLRKSAGCGDRLGLTTPGHVRAVRGSGIFGLFAQQSIREMARTQRSPEQVMDDATFGVFQEGYRDGFGSDADHLKTAEDIDACLPAGFTMFTIDPGAHVDNAADKDDPATLAVKFEKLPWSDLQTTATDCRRAYAGRSFAVGPKLKIEFSEAALLRAAAKYGAAIAHTARLYRHLAAKKGSAPFELEVSVDETASPTSVAEHLFVASELKRLGVKWASLAPRFIGDFEKGVDYIGSLPAFEREFAQHAAVARQLGPYKISLHSGSDKFSIYPIIARHAGELFHLKTAGTSYLEALRVIALCEPKLFREIAAFALQRYPEDRASYHVSADVKKAPDLEGLHDARLASVLDQFDAREILHVTYGSVLNAKNDSGEPLFRERLFQTLKEHEETYYAAIAKHIRRHLAPFIAPGSA